jgi:hypothetical protein
MEQWPSHVGITSRHVKEFFLVLVAALCPKGTGDTMNATQALMLRERGQGRASRVRVAAPTAAMAMVAREASLASLEWLEARLMDEFSPPLRPEGVQRCLFACVTRYQSVAVDTYVPLLIERDARRQLRVLCEMHH